MSNDSIPPNNGDGQGPTGADVQEHIATDEQTPLPFNTDQSYVNVHGGSTLAEDHFAITNGCTFDPADFLKFEQEAEQQSRKQRLNGQSHDPDIEVIKAAFAVIPSDNYDDWVVLAFILYRVFGDDGYKLWRDWSSKSAKYGDDKCKQKWEEEAHTTRNDVGLGTIFHKADEADPQWRQRYNRAHPKFEILPASQWFGERAAPIPPALIKGVLPQTGVATIGGQSGTGKSFHAIHLGVRLIPDCQQHEHTPNLKSYLHRKHFYIDKYRIKRLPAQTSKSLQDRARAASFISY